MGPACGVGARCVGEAIDRSGGAIEASRGARPPSGLGAAETRDFWTPSFQPAASINAISFWAADRQRRSAPCRALPPALARRQAPPVQAGSAPQTLRQFGRTSPARLKKNQCPVRQRGSLSHCLFIRGGPPKTSRLNWPSVTDAVPTVWGLCWHERPHIYACIGGHVVVAKKGYWRENASAAHGAHPPR
jgi:hypothetical protein